MSRQRREEILSEREAKSALPHSCVPALPPPPPPPLQAPAHSSQGSSRASVNGELLLLLAACTSVCLQKQSRAVRLNTVAILREGARVQREEEVETQRLVGLEAGQTDGSDYLKWQEEVKQVSPAP